MRHADAAEHDLDTEELLADALYPYPENLLIATKVGVAPPDGVREARICGRPGPAPRPGPGHSTFYRQSLPVSAHRWVGLRGTAMP